MRLSRVRNSFLAAKIDRVERTLVICRPCHKNIQIDLGCIKLELRVIYFHLMTCYHFLCVTTFNTCNIKKGGYTLDLTYI